MGRNGPIHLENELELTILRTYTSGGSGGLAVGRGRDHNSSLKEAPVLTYEIQTVSQGNETVVLQRRYKGR